MPPVPDYKLLCEAGCYLFAPIDEREARFNLERVAEIPGLKLTIEDLTDKIGEAQSQRDRSLSDAVKFRLIAETALTESEALEQKLREAYTVGDVTIAVFAGVGGGVLLAVIGTVVVLIAF